MLDIFQILIMIGTLFLKSFSREGLFFYLLIFASWDTSHDVCLGPMQNFGEQKLEKFYMWRWTTSF